MSNSKAEQAFKTKKEAHIYRLKKMFPKLIEKNEHLCGTSYKMFKGVEQSAIEGGHWKAKYFSTDVDDLKKFTYDFKDKLPGNSK